MVLLTSTREKTYEMKCLLFTVLISLTWSFLPASESSFLWDDYYFELRQAESRIRSVSDSCINQFFWAIFNWESPPRCVSIFHYHPEQADGEDKWCVDKHGTPLAHTLDMIQSFPFNCKKTRGCPEGIVYENTGRCEASCEEATSQDYRRTYTCKNRCICPRGMYLNKDKKCVWKSECETPPKPSCPSPMVYTECAAKCPSTCATPKPVCYHEGCKEKVQCVCPSHMVQMSTKNRTCVKVEDCPKCDHGSLPTDCAPVCPITCPDNTACKGSGCEEGVHCICPPGTARLDRLLPVRCVRKSECPPLCEPPRVPKGCGTACPPTCDNPNPVCTEECVPENICSCPDGYVQLSRSDKTCVKRSECPGCKAPAMPVKCTSVCPKRCDPTNPICVRECKSKYACSCPSGFLLKSLYSTECVKDGECPPVCESPKRYVQCPSRCPPTCQDPKPLACIRGCGSVQCVCPPNMVQPDDDTLTCIDPSDCPKDCEAPKIYQKCPSKCQPKCTNPNPDLNRCQKGCGKEKCVCPTGLVLLSSEEQKCVKPSQCPQRCEAPKRFALCASLCQPTCQDPKPISCKRGCSQQHCICPPNMVQPDKNNETCIYPSECPTVKVCAASEIRAECRSKCTPSCDNLANLNNEDCSLECGGSYCICKAGYVRKSKTDPTCVDITSCPPPAETTTAPVCEYPKIYAACPSKCPPTCANPKPLTCSRLCDPKVRCVCPKEFVQLDKRNRTCIKLEECPVCQEPKIFVECASKCRPTCQTPNPVYCDDSCAPDLHCVCPPGMVHPKHEDDSCIPLSECPESCKFPKVATKCASTCPATCDNPAPRCEEGCHKGVDCVCPRGLLQRSATNSTCVLPSQCPNLPNDCPLRKVPTRCANGCPATCENQNPRICVKPCRPEVNCECPRGMVQRSLEDDTCLWPYQCES